LKNLKGSEGDINVDLKEIVSENIYCISLYQDRVHWQAFMNKVKDLWIS